MSSFFSLNSIFDPLRRIVSGDKNRFDEKGFNLDFTYITDRMVAMAFPGEGIEGLWRNYADTVAQMLETVHGKDHYRIYNLSERKYSYEKFHNNVVEYGFPDHHNPPIQYLFEICKDIDEWLRKDKKNIAVVHCLAGRGRTGTVIACYLTFNGMFDNGSEALDFFALRRSSKDRGVNQPSQRRYVQYFSEILHGRKPNQNPLRLKRIIMYTIPNYEKSGCCPYLEIYTAPTQFKPKQLLYSSPTVKRYKAKDYTITFDIDCELMGDIYLRCYHIYDEKKPYNQKGNRKFMFRVSFHTGFVPSASVLRLTKVEIDDAIKSSKYDKDFFVDFIWEPINVQKQNLLFESSNQEQVNISIEDNVDANHEENDY